MALLAQIDDRQAFFQGARLALDVGAQVIKVNEMVELRDQLSDRSVSLWAIISESPATENTAQLLGLATRVSKPRPEEVVRTEGRALPEDSALFVNRTLRSGSRVEFDGNVVILGDVNPGAEVVVDGSVIVWGRLRGTVHAGSRGDRNAVVCALDLSPMRLQIDDEVLLSQDKKEAGKPEMAVLREQGIALEPWQSGAASQP